MFNALVATLHIKATDHATMNGSEQTFPNTNRDVVKNGCILPSIIAAGSVQS